MNKMADISKGNGKGGIKKKVKQAGVGATILGCLIGVRLGEKIYHVMNPTVVDMELVETNNNGDIRAVKNRINDLINDEKKAKEAIEYMKKHMNEKDTKEYIKAWGTAYWFYDGTKRIEIKEIANLLEGIRYRQLRFCLDNPFVLENEKYYYDYDLESEKKELDQIMKYESNY
jgi:hypothetical protein